MNRIDLAVEVVKEVGGSKKEASMYIDAVLKGIAAGLKNDGKVSLANFGVFSTSVKPAHEAHNPATGAVVNVPEKVVPKMRFSESMKDYLNS